MSSFHDRIELKECKKLNSPDEGIKAAESKPLSKQHAPHTDKCADLACREGAQWDR